MTDLLLANYPRQAVVRDRNSSGLLNWAAGVTARPIPVGKPPEDWVRRRLVAERIPGQPDNYVTRTMPYYQQHPATQEAIRQYLSQWNDEATETALSTQIQDVTNEIMPAFSKADVSDADVAAWYAANGFADPPA
jgi:hypothetical protein